MYFYSLIRIGGTLFKGTLTQYGLNRFGRIVLEDCPLFANSDEPFMASAYVMYHMFKHPNIPRSLSNRYQRKTQLLHCKRMNDFFLQQTQRDCTAENNESVYKTVSSQF